MDGTSSRTLGAGEESVDRRARTKKTVGIVENRGGRCLCFDGRAQVSPWGDSLSCARSRTARYSALQSSPHGVALETFMELDRLALLTLVLALEI